MRPRPRPRQMPPATLVSPALAVPVQNGPRARVRVRRVYPDDDVRRALRSGHPAEPLPTLSGAALAALAAPPR